MKNPSNTIKAVIFDYDDTLVQTLKVKVAAIQLFAKQEYNIDITKEQMLHIWGTPFDEFMKKLIGSPDTTENIRKKYLKISSNFPSQPHPQGIETIHYLKNKYLIGIVTSATKEVFIDDLQTAGYHPNDFFTLQAQEDTDFHKPDARVFLPTSNILQKQNITNNDMIYIGDNVTDALAAKDAQINFYAVLTGVSTKQDFIDTGLPEAYILDEIAQLQQIL